MKLSTFQQRRKRFFLGAFFVVAPGLIWGFFNMKAADFTTNFAQTSPDAPDQNLRTRFCSDSLESATQNIQALVPTLKTYGQNWKLRNLSQQNDVTTIHCEVRVLIFTDDLEVFLREENNRTRIDVRSRSRVGRGDLGENRRHIAQLSQKLDPKLHLSP